jgi:hypothetical protein
MENPKKRSIHKKQDAVQEPEAVYGTGNDLISNDPEELHPILVKLIEQSKAESEAGMGIPHEEVMRRVKLRYPFLK